jgi:hypothetical protein
MRADVTTKSHEATRTGKTGKLMLNDRRLFVLLRVISWLKTSATPHSALQFVIRLSAAHRVVLNSGAAAKVLLHLGSINLF